MDKYKDYDFLYGFSSATFEKTVIPNTLEDVADYIVREGLSGNVIITTPQETTILITDGIMVSECSDHEYLAALHPTLYNKQMSLFQSSNEDKESLSDNEEPEEMR